METLVVADYGNAGSCITSTTSTSENKFERPKKQLETCLKIDRKFTQARDALKRLLSSGQSNWYDWWFRDADNASCKNQISSISASLINISFAKVLSLNSSSHESVSRHLCVRKVCPREISIIKLYVRKICSR
jgi:hypothetical protein